MRISDVLAEKGGHVVTVWPDKRLGHVPLLFDAHGIASVVVIDHAGRPVGIVTDRELVRALARHGVSALDLPVPLVMLSPPPSCTPEHSVGDVLRQMTENRVRHVVVMRGGDMGGDVGGGMVGIVSIGDLVKVRLDDAELENRVLREMALARLAG